MATKSDLKKVEKYPVIVPSRMATAESIIGTYTLSLVLLISMWLIFSTWANFAAGFQFVFITILFFLVVSVRTSEIQRAEIDLKAKGLDIKDKFFTGIMPWDWLTEFEIRQRSWSIIPNYVYFKFKDNSDVLILWEDVADSMDSSTLISCVSTWAPHAKISGDANLAKSESIATYTELWLKDMNSAKTERRQRKDQLLSPGTVVSDSYEIIRVLSGGGQGTAYLATVLPQSGLPDMPPKVVVKEFILPANDRGLKKATDGLLKEVAILRRINHPRIVRLFDFFVEDMRGYLAIELIDGMTLRQIVSKEGPFKEVDVKKIGISLCEALSYLHTLNPPIIHGDVTPDNVMLEKNGNVKLLDFDASQELTRNKTNTVVGKHAYMSPEQFKGVIGEAGDIYALGCTLHFLLTGVDPEPISQSDPASIVNTVSDAMNEVVSKATKFDKLERYSKLNEMRIHLEQL